uniref:Uncharacterized protein n=1 Tax=Rhizophora mucronata TaxID=61149 RepID=A0A2P2QML0_RHIMU
MLSMISHVHANMSGFLAVQTLNTKKSTSAEVSIIFAH